MKWSFRVAKARKNEHASEFMMGEREISLITMCCIGATVLCVFVFWLFPNFDMWSMQQYYTDDGGFYLRSDVFLANFRKFVLFALFAFYVMVIAGWIDAYRKQEPVLGFTWDKWAYMGACALAGPVLVVNIILKGNWGRARPRDLEVFGGSLDYSQFYVWSDQCQDNCSFTSGEVAGVVMVFFALAFLLSRPARYVVFLIGVLLAAFVAWIRLAKGAHFPSDTIMAVVLMLFVATEVYYVFYLRKANWIANANEKQLAKLDREKLAAHD